MKPLSSHAARLLPSQDNAGLGGDIDRGERIWKALISHRFRDEWTVRGLLYSVMRSSFPMEINRATFGALAVVGVSRQPEGATLPAGKANPLRHRRRRSRRRLRPPRPSPKQKTRFLPHRHPLSRRLLPASRSLHPRRQLLRQRSFAGRRQFAQRRPRHRVLDRHRIRPQAPLPPATRLHELRQIRQSRLPSSRSIPQRSNVHRSSPRRLGRSMTSS